MRNTWSEIAQRRGAMRARRALAVPETDALVTINWGLLWLGTPTIAVGDRCAQHYGVTLSPAEGHWAVTHHDRGP